MDKICVIIFGYPNTVRPINHVFVRNLVWEWLDMGKDVTVIAPIAMHRLKQLKVPKATIEKSPGGKEYKVFRPKYFPLPRIKLFFLNTQRMFFFFRLWACKRIVRKYKIETDCFYGHFLSPAGICAAKLGMIHGRPAFIASGEGPPDWSTKEHTRIFLDNLFSYVSGVVAVSSAIKDFLVQSMFFAAQSICILPNGANTERFCPRDKGVAREMLGFSKDKFIAAFVGRFTEKKGICELNEAILQLDDAYAICAGVGPLIPSGKNILYNKVVLPENMPFFLNAADVFVLPTKLEACSNAIMEALASGLPIITSNLQSNYAILDETCAVFIDPNSVDEIRDAILTLKDNPELRERLARGSLEKSKEFSITKRAKNILEFMDRMVAEE